MPIGRSPVFTVEVVGGEVVQTDCNFGMVGPVNFLSHAQGALKERERIIVAIQGVPKRGKVVEAVRHERMIHSQRAFPDQLPLEFREIIVLREMEDYSYKEIADLVEVPVGTVMSRLARGRRQLQKILCQETQTPAGRP